MGNSGTGSSIERKAAEDDAIASRGKELTTRQCEMEFDVTGPVIAGDFRKLIEMGLAEKFGAGRSTRYRLKVQV